MVETPGYCSRRLNCSIAAAGRPVRVALEAPFLCPECGGLLTAPALDDTKPIWRRAALLAPLAALAAMLAGGAVLAKAGFFGAGLPKPAPAPVVVALAPAMLPNPAPASVVESLAPPALLALAMEEPPLPRAVAPHVHGKPGILTGVARKAPPGRRHADVHMSVSIPLVSGGTPEYPDQYQDGQSGDVTVACALAPNGIPEQCRTRRATGGRIFDVAVHSWLDLKDVRFQIPKTGRRPSVNQVVLTVHFIGDGPAP